MKQTINWKLYGAALSVNLISLVAGGSYSWTSPVLPKLNLDNEDNPLGVKITPFEESWIASLLSLGASIGPILAAAIVDRIGRKKTLLLVAVPLIISKMILAFATDISLYYFSRFFLGLGVGCVYSLVPVYIGEIAEDSNRGGLGIYLNLLGTMGSLFCFAVGPFVSIKIFCLLFVIPPVLFLIIFGLFVPETPYYLLLANRDEDAKLALMKLRGVFVEKELEEMKKNVSKSKETKFQFQDLFKSKSIRRGLLIGSGLMFLQQFCGISVVVAYLQSIFDATGTAIPSEPSAMVIGVVMVFINLSASFLIDRLGRRILLLISLTGLFISNTLLGIYFYLKANEFDDVVSYLSWLPICSLMLFIVMFHTGIGPVPWAMTGELFPSHCISIASTFVTFVCLFLAFVLTVFFPNFTVLVGMAGSFWLFAICCFFGVGFVWWVVPETKGKSLAEIQSILQGNKKLSSN